MSEAALSPSSSRTHWTVLAIGLTGLGLAAMGMVNLASLARVLLVDGLLVLGWLLGAAGWGWVVLAGGLPRADPVHRWGVGAAVQLLIVWLLGWAGGLNALTAWAVTLVGAGWLGWFLWPRRAQWACPATSPWVLAVVPAGVLLILASTVAPPLLWPSEHGGYDALAYHLQLPKEWLACGRVVGFEHNLYAYFPNLMEAGFMQLGAMRGSMVEAVHAAQGLHAAMAVLAGAAIGRLIVSLTGSAPAGWIGAALYLSVPWTIVTGSLAYNEQAVNAFAAVALGLALDKEAAQKPWRIGAVAGGLCGAAVLAKLTSVGMVALPWCVVWLWMFRSDRRTLARGMAAWCGVAMCVVGIWAVRNALWTGNPTFPFLSHLFGAAHMGQDQVQRLAQMQGPGPAAALGHLFSTDRGLGHVQFGHVIWPLGLWAAVSVWRDRALRPWGWVLGMMVGVQLLFWALATHHQSRFLTPLLVPWCLLMGLGVAGGLSLGPRRRPWALAVAVAGVLAMAGLAHGLFWSAKAGMAPHWIGGVAMARHAGPEANPFAALNALGPEARIYAEGFAIPFYVDRPIDYHTVWDASPLGQHLAGGGAAAGHRWLSAQGYSHVVIDWGMLARWWSPENYGHDPNITREKLEQLTGLLEPLKPWDKGPIRLYRVRPVAGAWPNR